MVWHKTLTPERWGQFKINQQVLMIANETNRANHWAEKNDKKLALNSLERALELLDLTVADRRWQGRQLPLLRLREKIAQNYINLFNTSEKYQDNTEKFVDLIKYL